MVVARHQLLHLHVHLTEGAVLLRKALRFVIHVTQLALRVAAPAVQVPCTRHRVHIVGARNHLHDGTLALANLAALEEIHPAEMIQRLVNNILVTKLSIGAVSTRVHTTLIVYQDGRILLSTDTTTPTSPAAKLFTVLPSTSVSSVGLVIISLASPEPNYAIS